MLAIKHENHNHQQPIFLKKSRKKHFPDSLVIDNIDEIPYYLMLLGNEYELYTPPKFYINASRIKLETAEEIFKLGKVFNKIPPIHDGIIDLDLALVAGDTTPQKIDSNLVHKNSEDNVMLSKPQKFCNMFYFNMIPETKEFIFDHDSDHIQGMLVTEVVRQCGIASTHLSGLSNEGKIVLSNLNLSFKSYLEKSHPIIIRSFVEPILFENNATTCKPHVLVNLIQFGKICAFGVVEGLAFNKKSDWISYNDRSHKIQNKIQSKYTKLIGHL